MAKIPGARVVRGGSGVDQREPGAGAGADVAPEGPVLRLAPRALPRSLILRMILGGHLGVSGWLAASLGMVLVLVLLPMVDLSVASSYDRHATATMTSIEDTGSRENKRKIYRVRYRFVDEAGVERLGVSYTEDPPAHLGPRRVLYQRRDPLQSRLEGMRRSSTSVTALFVLLFPAFGIGLALKQVPGALRNLRLLRYGVETKGRLIRQVAIPDRDEKAAPMSVLTFEYEVDGKPYTATMKTQEPGPLLDDEREAMIYDPRAPRRATTLDHLPGSVRITAGGELEVLPGSALHLLILPIVFVGLVVATVIRMS